MMNSNTNDELSSSWQGVEDFGQKVDLTVRIREILRNYPEGLSIIKELLQNADDAGARTVRFCAYEPPMASTSNDSRRRGTEKLEELMQGPSLLAYNSAKFTETDFKSIQRIGDSLKKAAGNKTGRFGVGVNSTYHLTDVPMFLSAEKAVLFDPQAKYIPNINPANPGKMIDLGSSKNQSLIQQLPNVFRPFGSEFFGNLNISSSSSSSTRQQNQRTDGTTFRFALRTTKVASESRLSRQAHTFESICSLLDDLSEAAPSMLLFLKHVERIEIFEWRFDSGEPLLKHCTQIQHITQQLRQKRSYMLQASPTPEKPIVIDYQIELESNRGQDKRPYSKETWMVCNQMGGGMASQMAKDPTWSHMNLVPWAGVAARVDTKDNDNAQDFNGAAYCFLPLPVSTKLPIHVNGYFELSSNRRDVWWGEDMAGDGLARAQWNQSLVTDIAARCYIRLIYAAIHKTKVLKANNYEHLWPTSSSVHGPWAALANEFLSLTRQVPCLFSENAKGWVTPEKAVVLPEISPGTYGAARATPSGTLQTMTQLGAILKIEGPAIPLVILSNAELHSILLKGKCGGTVTKASPSFVRGHFAKRTDPGTGLNRVSNGALEVSDPKEKFENAMFLLEYCLQDIYPNSPNSQSCALHSLTGCQFIPLANGMLGTFCILDSVQAGSLAVLSSMGFTRLQSMQALRKHKGDVNAAMEWMIEQKSGDAEMKSSSKSSYNDTSLQFGIDPFFATDDRELSYLLRQRASNIFVDLQPLKQQYPKLYKFFKAVSLSVDPVNSKSNGSTSSLNLVMLEPSLISDIVSWVLPPSWKKVEEVEWSTAKPEGESVNVVDSPETAINHGLEKEWFRALWRYLCKLDHPEVVLQSLSEQYCIVPTQQNVVCILSPGSSVLDASSTALTSVIDSSTDEIRDAIIALGGRFLLPNVLPSDLAIPKDIYSYIHPFTPDGIIRGIEAAVRRIVRRQGTGGLTEPKAVFERLSEDSRVALKAFFSHPAHQSLISDQSLLSLASFPLFRSYVDSSSETTKFVSLRPLPPPTNTEPWLLIEGTTTKTDRKLMSSRFISYDSRAEISLLKKLGVQTLTRSRFIMDFVIHLLPHTDAETRTSSIRSLLLNLSSLLSGEENFQKVVMKSAIFPTATSATSGVENQSNGEETKPDQHTGSQNTSMSTEPSTLKRACDLFDPSVPAFRLLMSDDSFPAEFLWTDQFLSSLRLLGLRTSLDWDTVLLCAKSIEEQGSSPSKEEREKAKARGKELLEFLDEKWETFFPDIAASHHEKTKKSSKSLLGHSLFEKMSAALFEDPQQKQREAEDRARKLHTLLGYRWVPVMEEPPHPFLPWDPSFSSKPVARPSETVTREGMWFLSSQKRILDASVRSAPLAKLFGWSITPQAIEVAMQLRQLSSDFESLFVEKVKGSQLKQDPRQGQEAKSSAGVGEFIQNSSNDEEQVERQPTEQYLCQTMSAHIPELYNILDGAASKSGYEREVMQSTLSGTKWLWIGNKFVSSEHAAFESNVIAAPYLYLVPSDLRCFDRLHKTLGVRQHFYTTDYVSVLSRMAKKQDGQEARRRNPKESAKALSTLSARDIELAIQLVQLVSDEVLRLAQGTMSDLYAPSSENEMHLTSSMMYDDAPWLSKTGTVAAAEGEESAIFIHPKISSAVAEKVGATSFRQFLLQSKTDLEFGTGIAHEAFGQSESITRRLRNIIEMYPEGPQQLSELIQNADDARATEVKFMISLRHHGTKSLLGPKLKEWQGPSLLVYNNSVFSKNDFVNISRIGQASKLEKLTSTGRFGLGFNSVFHWTDVPTIVSGEHMVMFDPHEHYVPGATSSAKGIKIKFAGGSKLAQQFPDQVAPLISGKNIFGCDMEHFFQGTLMRFPFRNEYTSKQSEISKTRADDAESVQELLNHFKQNISKVLLFLRNVTKIQMYFEGSDDDSEPVLLYESEVAERQKLAGQGLSCGTSAPSTGLDHFKSALAAATGTSGIVNPNNNSWSAVSDFIQPPGAPSLGKDAFYSKLLSTPERMLPRTQHVLSIKFTEYDKPREVHISSSTSTERRNLTTVHTPSNRDSDDHDEGVAIEVQRVVSTEDDEASFDAGSPGRHREGKIHSKSAVTAGSILDKYLILTALGGGRCQMMACNPKFRHMKLLPWGGVAVHMSRNGKQVVYSTTNAYSGEGASVVTTTSSIYYAKNGNAFCFLPLPAETGLPPHINGYFELSANRRDIWHGDDMTGEGRIRCEWNNVLLSDVIAPLYVNLIQVIGRLILHQGHESPSISSPGDFVDRLKYYHSLFPVAVKHDVWKQVLQEFYKNANQRPILYSELNGGTWIKPTEAVTIEAWNDLSYETACVQSNQTLHNILLRENVQVTCLPRSIMKRLREEGCSTSEATPAWTRSFFRKQQKQQGGSKSLMKSDSSVSFLLDYCTTDLLENGNFDELSGLSLVPLCNGSVGQFETPATASTPFFVCTQVERDLLNHACSQIVDVWGPEPKVNELFRSGALFGKTNIKLMDTKHFVTLLQKRYPIEWQDLPEVRWDPSASVASLRHPGFQPFSLEWLSKLWSYILSKYREREGSAKSSKETASDPASPGAVLAAFGDSCHILPSVVGAENDKTLMKLSNEKMAVVSPSGVRSDGNTLVQLPNEVGDVLKAIGVRILDVSTFGASSDEGSDTNGTFERDSIVEVLSRNGFVQLPDAIGLLRAIQATFPPDIEDGDLIRRIGLRFRHVGQQGKNVLRDFLCLSMQVPSSNADNTHPRRNSESPIPSQLDDALIRIAKALPIFRVYTQKTVFNAGPVDVDNSPAEQFSDIIGKKFLPPVGYDEAFLDQKFVKITTFGAQGRSETAMMKVLGVVPMEKHVYYEEQVCGRLNAQEGIGTAGALTDAEAATIIQILEDLPKLSRDATTSHISPEQPTNSWLRRMSEKLRIPNRLGQRFKASELYDPYSPALSSLLDDSMIPHETFCQRDLLVSLRMLGMKTELSIEGVLLTARRVESLHNTPENVTAARKLGLSLLNFLDDEDTLKELEQKERDPPVSINSVLHPASSGDGVEIESSVPIGTPNAWETLWYELREISWIPVELFNDVATGRFLSNRVLPPRPRRAAAEAVTVSSPLHTRPPEDAWLCSFTMEVATQTIRTSALRKCLGWDENLSATVLAQQLVALSDGVVAAKDGKYDRPYRKELNKVLPVCYEMLDAHFQEKVEENDVTDAQSALEEERAKLLLRGRAWVWVGDSFVTVQRVAFDAPENARPYLFSVPMDLLPYRALLSRCGVRERFSASDYANLTASLYEQLNGQAASDTQLDLAIGMAKLLSRVPAEERKANVASKIYLPAADKTLHNSLDMIFNDAHWLSTIISRRAGSHFLFVHEDVGNDVARACGAKSFRDTITAHQNGMSTLPCPKPDSLSLLFKEREGYKKEEGTDGQAQPNNRHALREDCRAVLDILELAEIRGTRQVSVMFDHRNHRNERLLHPMLSQSQGPSIVVCLHDTLMDVEDIVKLSSPHRHYMGHVNGEQGCASGGQGMPRSGMRICGVYRVTDCPQILLGDSLIFFDPNGECFYDGNLEYEQTDDVHQHDTTPTNNDSSSNTIEESDADAGEEAHVQSDHDVPLALESPRKQKFTGETVARQYCVNSDFAEQFPDQFETFSSLPFGVKEALHRGGQSFKYRGTIFRLPLRQAPSPICNRVFSSEHTHAVMQMLISQVPTSFLFTCSLQCIDVSQWNQSEPIHKGLLSSRVTSSPLARQKYYEHFEEYEWKPSKSKIAKLLQSNWTPVRTHMTVEVTSSLNDKDEPKEFVDSFLIASVFGPTNLRKMACADVVKPLRLLPYLALSAHISRKSTLDDGYVKPPRRNGSVFVGLDCGEETGLPFHVNAPLFLHETKGSVLLDKSDDSSFRARQPKTREVVTKDGERKVVALHVWNREALLSACVELIPSILKHARDMIVETEGLNSRDLYRLWPRHDKIISKFAPFVGKGVCEQIAKSGSKLFLTQKGKFESVDDGCFASPSYQIRAGAGMFFQSKLSMFAVPQFVAEDLVRADIALKKLSPATARRMIKKHPKLLDTCRNDTVLLVDILEYCLSDLVGSGYGGDNTSAGGQAFKDILGLPVLPMQDGSLRAFGREVILASPEQQFLLPFLKDRYISSYAVDRLSSMFRREDFIKETQIRKFDAAMLSENMRFVLPSHWEGKEFVPWDPETSSSPDKAWLFRFWSEVDVSNADDVQLFRRWPLIPTKHNELASCGNLSFVLHFYPDCVEQKRVHEALLLHDKRLIEDLEAQNKKLLSLQAAEERAARQRGDFGCFDLSDDESSSGGNDERKESGDDPRSDHVPQPEEVTSTGEIPSHPDVESIVQFTVNPALRTPGVRALDEIVTKLRCPMMEVGYFAQEQLAGILPDDRLSVSRSTLVTINHCMNYWTHYRASELDAEEARLQWTALSEQDMDDLLLLLTSGDNGRLSLLPSDMAMVRKLPIFQTLSGERVSIEHPESHFTLHDNVEVRDLSQYLPRSLKNKFLADKSNIQGLLEDLGVQELTEAVVMQKFVLPELQNMPANQKDKVCQMVLEKWDTLKTSEAFLETLKTTPFVKKKASVGEEIVYVKPSDLLDPRHPLLESIFDQSSSVFPYGEFRSSQWLAILSTIGLQEGVSPETFVKCARTVESEKNVEKAFVLHEYFVEHYTDLSSRNFTSQFSGICCVPASLGEDPISLFKFGDVGVPAHRNLVFLASPIMPQSIVPPQVLFSSLGVVSPPKVETVLKHFRLLTQDGGKLDQWSYQYGTVEQVFRSIFAFLEDNMGDISPRVMSALKEKPVVPVGSTLVKTRRLFFRLTKDLAPFFYEVPRVFGAHERFFRELGVRESPQWRDYSVSLAELKNEIGNSRMNANELRSVLDVVQLIASDCSSMDRSSVYVPDEHGSLVSLRDTVRSDAPWLLQGRRLDRSLLHLSHPKLTSDLCQRLGIPMLSECVEERLNQTFDLITVPSSDDARAIRAVIQSEEFGNLIEGMLTRGRKEVLSFLKGANLVEVESLRTYFFLCLGNNMPMQDVTLDSRSLCFLDKAKDRILLARRDLPPGVSPELAIATAMCDQLHLPRYNVAGIAALLSCRSSIMGMDRLSEVMGICTLRDDESRRGDPGTQVCSVDMELMELKPLKVFSKGEVVAVRDRDTENEFLYASVLEQGGGQGLSQVKLDTGNGTNFWMTTEIYSFKTAAHSGDVSHEAILVPESTFENLLERTSDLTNEAETGPESNASAVKRQQVLGAVQDLLKSANMSLSNNIEDLMGQNLKLQDQLLESEAASNVMRSKGHDLAQTLERGVDAFLCPITRDVMRDPVICSDGHTYEREAIELWLRSNSRSPKTNQHLPSRTLIPNHSMKQAIEAMEESIASVKRFSRDLGARQV